MGGQMGSELSGEISDKFSGKKEQRIGSCALQVGTRLNTSRKMSRCLAFLQRLAGVGKSGREFGARVRGVRSGREVRDCGETAC
jgi:hypothetical protein